MILPSTYGAALFLMILSMLCWGSWANTYKAAGKWRFELFYFDYAVGLLLASLVFAFTFGNLGYDGFSFLDDLLHAGKREIFYGFIAGVVFNLANMLLVAAISVAGLAVAFPVGIGLALIEGVILNYWIKPAGDPTLLFLGCGLIVAAIIVDALAYRGVAVLRHEEAARAGLAKSTRRPASIKGIILSLASGLLMGAFFPLVEKGKETEIGLGPYAITVVFAAGVFFSTFVFNLFFMNLPVEGEPVEIVDYFKGSPKQHLLGLLGGAIWCTGATAAFVVASATAPSGTAGGGIPAGAATPATPLVGPAISYAMGQGATLISALWGLLVWKEFRGADARIKALATLMLFLFVAGLTLVSLAALFSRVQ
jgi:glucose uptake protein